MATINLGSIKFNWKGTYAGGTAYVVDDVVEYNGSSYICILASTGNLPTNGTYFSVMSQAGTDGTDVGTTLTTQGDILYRDGSGLQRLGAGTSGQALITGGTGANPSWGSAGGLVQLKAVEKSNTQSWQNTNENEITGLNVSITPSSASNKILVVGQLWTSQDTSTVTAFNALKRSIDGGTYATIGNHSSDGSDNTKATGHGGTYSGNWNLMNTSVSFLDNPNTTNSINYKWYMRSEDSSGATYINRTARNNTQFHPRLMSTITLMEIDAGVL